jgi:hypothetical protein
VNVRINGQLPNSTGAAQPPKQADVYRSNYNNHMKSSKLAVIIVCSIGGALVLIALIAVYCSRERFGKRGRNSIANTYQSYRNLNAPAPAGDMHQVQGYYGQGGAPTYTNTWGRR